jgi:HD superfamily phosphohydrolase YqeK
MLATTANSLAKKVSTLKSIEQPLRHTLGLIHEAATEGQMEVILPADYTLRGTSNSEFSELITHLRSQGYNCTFGVHDQRPLKAINTHTLDVNKVTVSWN